LTLETLFDTINIKINVREGLKMILGYARVSTEEQNLDRQLDSLKAAGCEKIFQEKITGTKRDREELDKLLEQMRQGDTVVISDLTRLSRSTKDLIELSEKLRNKGVELKSLKESIDTSTATGKAMFGMLAVIAQFERDLISERTKEGLASARARGRNGGRPTKNNKDIDQALKLYEGKQHTVKEIEELTGVSKPTLYRYINKNEEGK
jgi:DNA invertase Pin-like site-specific DNA recombinase